MTTTPTPTERSADVVDLLELLATAAEQYLATDHRSPAREAELRRNLSDATYDAFARLRPDPPAPVLPPIPEPGLYLDRDECVWRIHANGLMGPVGGGKGCHWDQGHTYGPFARLVPATDVVDAAIARELTGALAELFYAVGDWQPELRERVRDLLARAEGATGGGQ